MKYYRLTIAETGASCPAKSFDGSECFNKINIERESLDEIKVYLEEHYGKMPKGNRKIYVDKKGEIDPIEAGFLYSYWNQDISHMTPKWYQTDWIEIQEIEEERKYILL